MGLGFPAGEFITQLNISAYDTVVMKMSQQGIINSAAFSLYLNDDESQGNILFGGYDKAKYSGDLQTLDVVKFGDYGVCFPFPPFSAHFDSFTELKYKSHDMLIFTNYSNGM
jgi:hypothetical protein